MKSLKTNYISRDKLRRSILSLVNSLPRLKSREQTPRLALACSGSPASMLLASELHGVKFPFIPVIVDQKKLPDILFPKDYVDRSDDRAESVRNMLFDMGIKNSMILPDFDLDIKYGRGNAKQFDLTHSKKEILSRYMKLKLITEHCYSAGIWDLLTAETLDDSARVMIERSKRGFGLEGLSGLKLYSEGAKIPSIPPDLGFISHEGEKNNVSVLCTTFHRPLIHFATEDIKNLCQEQQIPFIEKEWTNNPEYLTPVDEKYRNLLRKMQRHFTSIDYLADIAISCFTRQVPANGLVRISIHGKFPNDLANGLKTSVGQGVNMLTEEDVKFIQKYAGTAWIDSELVLMRVFSKLIRWTIGNNMSAKIKSKKILDLMASVRKSREKSNYETSYKELKPTTFSGCLITPARWPSSYKPWILSREPLSKNAPSVSTNVFQRPLVLNHSEEFQNNSLYHSIRQYLSLAQNQNSSHIESLSTGWKFPVKLLHEAPPLDSQLWDHRWWLIPSKTQISSNKKYIARPFSISDLRSLRHTAIKNGWLYVEEKFNFGEFGMPKIPPIHNNIPYLKNLTHAHYQTMNKFLSSTPIKARYQIPVVVNEKDQIVSLPTFNIQLSDEIKVNAVFSKRSLGSLNIASPNSFLWSTYERGKWLWCM